LCPLTDHAAVLGADEERRLDAGLAHPVPVQSDLLHEPFLEPEQPLLRDGGGDGAVAGPDEAGPLHRRRRRLLLLVVVAQRAGKGVAAAAAAAKGFGTVHVPCLGPPVQEPSHRQTQQ
jgi:hypothetical protein